MSALKLTNEVKIILYGGGFKAKEMELYLLNENLKVSCILDKNEKGTLFHFEEPVYLPGQEPLITADRDFTLVIITINNVFEHDEIAQDLSKMGYKYILFKSFRENYLDISNIYDDFYNNCILRNKEIPEYRICEIKDIDYLSVVEINDDIQTRIPVELLFAMPKENIDNLPTGRSKETNKLGKNVLYFLYCYYLFEAFENGITIDYWHSYIKWLYQFSVYGMMDEANKRENFKIYIKKRYEIYQNMNYYFHYHNNFFEENPIVIKWSEKGYFHIIDGQNRAAFLLTKGFRHIMCKMRKEDFIKWKDNAEAKKLKQIIFRLPYDVVFPVLHPDFLGVRNNFAITYTNILMKYCFNFEKNNILLENTRLLAIGNESYYAQHFVRMGAYVEYLCSDPNSLPFVLCLSRLYKNDSLYTVSSAAIRNREYDMVFVENILKDRYMEDFFTVLNCRYICIQIVEGSENEILSEMPYFEFICIFRVLLNENIIGCWLGIQKKERQQ